MKSLICFVEARGVVLGRHSQHRPYIFQQNSIAHTYNYTQAEQHRPYILQQNSIVCSYTHHWSGDSWKVAACYQSGLLPATTFSRQLDISVYSNILAILTLLILSCIDCSCCIIQYGPFTSAVSRRRTIPTVEA